MPKICCEILEGGFGRSRQFWPSCSFHVSKSACVGEIARLLKLQFTEYYKNVPAGKIKLFAFPTGSNNTDFSQYGLEWSVDYLRKKYLELDLKGKLEDQLPPTVDETEAVHVGAMVPMKRISYLIVRSCGTVVVDFFYVDILESGMIRDLKNHIVTTYAWREGIKLVLGKYGDQYLVWEDVVDLPGEKLSEDVKQFLQALIAKNEIDLTRTVRSVFGDSTARVGVGVLVVVDDSVMGKRKKIAMSYDDDCKQVPRTNTVLQSAKSLPPVQGLPHVMQNISDFVSIIPDTIDLAVREGWRHVVRAYGDTLPCSLDAMDEAAGGGHLEVVKWLHDHHPEWNSYYGLVDAMTNDHFEVVDWLIEYGRDWDFNWTDYMRCDCSERMLKYLTEKKLALSTVTKYVVVEAARSGRLDEVERFRGGCSVYQIKVAMAEAAGHSQLDVVKFLLKEYQGYNTRLAVETAAAAGHIEVLDLLLCNQSEHLVIASLESAARHGRLDVLEYFEKYAKSMDEAGKEQKFIYKRMEASYRVSDALGEAARAGHREAVRWILDSETLGCKEYGLLDVIMRAVRDRQHEVVEFICSCCSEDEIYSALSRGISFRCRLDVIKAIYDSCLPDKLANTASTLLAEFNIRDEDIVKFLRSVQHIWTCLTPKPNFEMSNEPREY